MRVALAVCVLVACGKGGSPPKKQDDAAPISIDAAVAVVEPLTLGLPDFDAHQWRKRGGHPAFRVARTAEARSDWKAVIETCRQALTADPSHLEAAWLLAAALGREGRTSEILAPLSRAVAGDFAKWGHASLELPALEAFRATPEGKAWVARVEQDRAAYVAALARAVIVEADGDFYAVDRETSRWHRLSRTYGAVIGGLRVPSANKLLYVARLKKKLAIGTVDLARGRVFRPIDTATDKPLVVTYQTKTNPGPWFAIGKVWSRIDESWKVVALPPKTTRPPGPYLEVRDKQAMLRALPVAGIVADWDEHGLASAIKLAPSSRIVSVASPGLIDGHTVVWSADRARLAFVAQLAEDCTPGSIAAAAFVADAATGKLQEIERAAKGLAVEWAGEHELAVAGDAGVTIVNLSTGEKRVIEGARGLVTPRRRPRCTAAGPEPPEPPEPDDPDSTESEPVEPLDDGH